jgi:hypothetical protein
MWTGDSKSSGAATGFVVPVFSLTSILVVSYISTVSKLPQPFF